MKNIVCKFGGTSLASTSQILKVKDIVLSGKQKFIVLSAPGKRYKDDIKITDILISIWNKARLGQDYSNEFSFFIDRFNSIKQDLGVDIDLNAMYDALNQHLSTLCEYDYVISRGEYFMAKIFAKHMGFNFLDAKDFIVFDKDANVDICSSQTRFNLLVKDNGRFVIPGFYGDYFGRVKTFSRGGSDITGAIVALLCKANIYQNYTDVDGFLCADPKICNSPRLIKKLSYSELRELSYTGANVLHTECVKFLRENNITLNLRNTFKSTCKGSLIMPDRKIQHKHISGISGKDGYSLFVISSFGLSSSIGNYILIEEIFNTYNINIEHLHSGIDTLSILVSASLEKEIVQQIMSKLRSKFDQVDFTPSVAILSIVGKGLKNCKVEKKVLNAIYAINTQVYTLNKGSEGISLIFSIPKDDYESTITNLYHTLFEEKK